MKTLTTFIMWGDYMKRDDQTNIPSFFWNLGIDEKRGSKKVKRWANEYLQGYITEEELIRRVKHGE